jgi:hypothetical protein
MTQLQLGIIQQAGAGQPNLASLLTIFVYIWSWDGTNKRAKYGMVQYHCRSATCALESTVATGIVYLYQNGAQQNLVYCIELNCQRKLKGMLLIYMRCVILIFSAERCLGSVENARSKCVPASVRARQHPDPDQASEGENPPAPLQIDKCCFQSKVNPCPCAFRRKISSQLLKSLIPGVIIFQVKHMSSHGALNLK